MKKIFGFAIVALMFGQLAHAGSATSYRNDALGFTMVVPAMSDGISFYDGKNTWMEFESVSFDEKTGKALYRESSGKCEIQVGSFSKDFAEGKTKDDYMLSFGIQIVQVVKGKCELTQQLPNQSRSLTGIYN